MAFLSNALQELSPLTALLSLQVKILLFLVKPDLLAPCLLKCLVNPCRTVFVFLSLLSMASRKPQCKVKCLSRIQLSMSVSSLALIRYRNINKLSYDNSKVKSLANPLKCTILLLE